MVNGQAGKGSTYRPVNRRNYERGYLRVFGIECPECGGASVVKTERGTVTCPTCNGEGLVDRKDRMVR